MSKQAGMGCARGILCSLHNGLLITHYRVQTKDEWVPARH
jgi:hypothetical protein